MIKQPFFPAYGTNQVVSPAAGSATITINKDNRQVRIVNTGANIAYVQTFSSQDQAGTTATTADFAVPAGAMCTISKDTDHDQLAHISASGTTLNIMTGDGY